MPEQLLISDFSGRIQEVFSILLDSGDRYSLELVEVAELTKAPDHTGRQPFALIFRNRREDAYLPQAIYTISHDDMGDLALFLVPLGPHRDGMRYEAIFT